MLLLVARTKGTQIAEILADASEITRLGEGVDRTHRLSDRPVERTVSAAARFVCRARQLGAEEIWATATSAVRNASNRADFLGRARAELGVAVEELSGQEEAQRAFLGVQGIERFGSYPLAVVDVGGGSTEIILGHAEGLEHAVSLELGCVRLTERFLGQNPVSDAALSQSLDFAHRMLRPHLTQELVRGRTFVGVGGTATALAAVDQGMAAYDRKKVDGRVLPASRLHELLERLRRMDLESRKRVAGLRPKRADVIVAGAVIFHAALQLGGARALAVSDRGIRYGTILKQLSEKG